MKTLYCNGDSFIFGMECLGDHSRDENNKEFAFPAHVRASLGCTTYINNAYSGATNDFIFRTTVADLIELEKSGSDPADVFVLIGWTSLDRSFIDADAFPITKALNLAEEATDHGIIFVNPGFRANLSSEIDDGTVDISKKIVPFLVNHIWTDPVLLPTLRAQITCLEEFLKSKGYQYAFVATCGNYDNFTLLQDSAHWFWPKERTFAEWAFKNYNSNKRAEHHFDSKTHTEFGNLLVDYITKNNLY
jgi:hypothetical protein